MEEQKIKEIFSAFDPDLSSESKFMQRFECNMEALEMVRQEQRRQRVRNRRAVVLAALAGILSGVSFTLLCPFVAGWLSSLRIAIPDIQLPLLGSITATSFPDMAETIPSITLILSASAAILATLVTYRRLAA